VVAPVFFNGSIAALVSCTSHLIDIGGIGFGPDGKDVYMEGLNIPLLKVVDQGTFDRNFIEMVKSNSRLPLESEGDVYSLVACCDTGNKRLSEMMAEFNMTSLEPLGDYIIEQSRNAVVEQIAKLPKGAYKSELTLDGYDEPVTIVATITVHEDHVELDFTGSSPVSRYGINVPITYTKAYSSFALGCAICPGIPNNAGSLEAYRISAPRGSILNAPRPHAVAVRHVIGQILPDAVFGCLRQFVPDRVPAEGTSCLWNLILRNIPGANDEFTLMAATNGGTGARPGLDGLSATAFPSGVKGTPMEILESTNPILVKQKQLRPNSGGKGEFRGGHGQEIEISHINGEAMELLAAYDRIQNPPRGASGGSAGASGYVGLSDGTKLKAKGAQVIPGHDTLIIKTPGGGGWGDPEKRDQMLVERDEKSELQS